MNDFCQEVPFAETVYCDFVCDHSRIVNMDLFVACECEDWDYGDE